MIKDNLYYISNGNLYFATEGNVVITKKDGKISNKMKITLK
jgi:hypothetical protein